MSSAGRLYCWAPTEDHSDHFLYLSGPARRLHAHHASENMYEASGVQSARTNHDGLRPQTVGQSSTRLAEYVSEVVMPECAMDSRSVIIY